MVAVPKKINPYGEDISSSNDLGVIKELEQAVASRIAAGEVIDRPASIVKELVENSLDAGATSIAVEITEGGTKSIRVNDNGSGFRRNDLPLAFVRHATSKITTEQDLFRIESLGFRGEALASIAAAANCQLISRYRGASEGFQISTESGKISPIIKAACPTGTTIQVSDLFSLLPGRLKFLASVRAETSAISRTLSEISLAYPDVAFSFTADSHEKLKTPGNGNPKDAVAAIHSAEIANNLLQVGYEVITDEDKCSVSGLCGTAAIHRGNRSAIHLIVNGRTILSKTLSYALERAYKTLIPLGRFPVAVIKITLPPEDIDVNVHPTKLEIKFKNEKFISSSINRAVVQALSASTISKFQTNYDSRLPSESNKPNIGLFRNPRIHKPNAVSNSLVNEEKTVAANLSFNFVESQKKMPFISADSASVIPIGQLKKTYILCEGPKGLLLIDQHAADERVKYEELQTAFLNSSMKSQPLLNSAMISTSLSISEHADEEKLLLQSAGWDFDILGPTNILLRSIPAHLAGKNPIQSFMKCLDELGQEERLSKPDALTATIACHSAIRAGDVLDKYTMQTLIANLTRSTQPFTCAHGRPTMIEIDENAIHKQFMR